MFDSYEEDLGKALLELDYQSDKANLQWHIHCIGDYELVLGSDEFSDYRLSGNDLLEIIVEAMEYLRGRSSIG